MTARRHVRVCLACGLFVLLASAFAARAAEAAAEHRERELLASRLKRQEAERATEELGRKLLERVAGDVTEFGKIEAIPRLEGRQMVMMIAPKKK